MGGPWWKFSLGLSLVIVNFSRRLVFHKLDQARRVPIGLEFGVEVNSINCCSETSNRCYDDGGKGQIGAVNGPELRKDCDEDLQQNSDVHVQADY